MANLCPIHYEPMKKSVDGFEWCLSCEEYQRDTEQFSPCDFMLEDVEYIEEMAGQLDVTERMPE